MVNERVFEVITGLMRRRRRTYAMLAEHLGMSESGVKKMFAAQDCTLSRLGEIAVWLEVPLEEIVRDAERPAVRSRPLDIDIQRWFVARPDVFAVFWKTTVERLSARDVAADLEVDVGDVAQMLVALEEQGLLELADELRGVTPVQWLDYGPLLDHLNRTWTSRLVEDVLVEPDAAGWVFRLHQLPMRPESLRAVQSDLLALCDDALRRARREASVTPRDARVTARLMVACRPGSFVE